MLMPGRSSTPTLLKKYVNLNKFELDGLSWTINFLSKIPASKKWIPRDITDPDALISDVEVSSCLVTYLKQITSSVPTGCK